ELRIESLVDGDADQLLAKPDRLGRATRIEDAQARYIEFAKRTFPKELRLDGMRIVIDCANGAGYRVAPMALWELGAEVISIGVEPDGFNINEKCGSTAPEKLADKVRELRADIGIALDGDADRVAIIDENGQTIDGDQLMALIAASWHARGQLRGDGLVTTVMSNLGLERHLAAQGIGLARTQVGDRYVVEHMREHDCNIGGEQSGHIVLSDFSTTGDGLIAALQVLAVVVESGKPVSEVCNVFTPLPQVLKNVRYASGKPLELPAVQSAIRDAQAQLKDSGRLVIRPSGTEPLIRVMAEGDDPQLVNTVVDHLVDILKREAA
ncbi:MAG: phosphoglucosamine mutase, partial [Hyphomicrobiales bacterium]|nr:phosphoglucosamine mutase [Hyphomicrobiales bacterium]